MVSVKNGLLSIPDYSDALINLADANHYFTSIGADELYRLAEKNGWASTPRLRRLLDMVWNPDADISSASVVTGQFLVRVWGHCPIDTARRLTFLTLEALAASRWSIAPQLITNLVRIIGPRVVGFEKAIRDWYQGHFLIFF